MTLPAPNAAIWPSAFADPVGRQREFTRTALAFLVVGTLFLVVCLIFAWYFPNHRDRDGLDTLLTGLFAPLVGVVGTVLGFYFGSDKSD